MAKKTAAKVNPVTDALRKLKEEEAELIGKLKPVQEAIAALENIVDKSGKKSASSSSAKEDNHFVTEESAQEAGELFQ